MSNRKHTHRLQVLVPESLAARLRQAARRGRVSQGEWVRRAIERSLTEVNNAPDPVKELARLDAPTGDIESILREIEDGRE